MLRTVQQEQRIGTFVSAGASQADGSDFVPEWSSIITMKWGWGLSVGSISSTGRELRGSTT